ncbi:hypothetical protein Tco_0225953, partial [Tanacetum coccineum]
SQNKLAPASKAIASSSRTPYVDSGLASALAITRPHIGDCISIAHHQYIALKHLKDELKSYALSHNLLDLGDSAKAFFKIYDMLETIQHLQVFESCSHVPKEVVSHWMIMFL